MVENESYPSTNLAQTFGLWRKSAGAKLVLGYPQASQFFLDFCGIIKTVKIIKFNPIFMGQKQKMKSEKLGGLLVLGMAIFGLAFFVTGASAQESVNSPNSEDILQEAEAVLVATVNIYDAKIVSQADNNFKISFDLFNRESAQPGIKYAVQLIKQENNSQSLVDEKVYSETVSLDADATVKKEIEYAAPAYLSGKFQLWLVSKNESGLTLALGNLGEVTLAGDNQFVEIINNSCYLKVDGEETKYTLKQGVDISREEKLIAVCGIVNNLNRTATLAPEFVTYWRTTFGKKVEDNNQPQQAIVLNPKEKKTISLTLPQAQTPQAYDVKLALLENNQPVSNLAIFHYVLRGPSATIQNLRLDKDYYQKGETAKASLFWSASADSSPDSRSGATDNGQMYVNISIKSGENKNCSDKAREKINPQDSTAVYDLPITSECADPKISVSIQDEKGNILDWKEYSLTSQNVPPKASAKTESKEEQKSRRLLYGIIFIIVLTIVSLIAIVIKKRKIVLSLIFFLIVLGGMFLAGKGARADTYVIPTRTFYGDGMTTLSIGIDKRTYSPNERIQINALATSHDLVIGQVNYWISYGLGVTVNSRSYRLWIDPLPVQAMSWASGRATGTVEGVAGRYNAVFTIYFNNGASTSNLNIPYTVVAPSPAPICSVSFFRTAITAPGSSTATVTMNNATGATYGCTGPIPAPFGSALGVAASATYPFNFTSTQTGTETCTVSVTGPGGSGSCSGSVSVNPPVCTPTNSCQTSTCSSTTCWNGCNNVSGTLTCGVCGSANRTFASTATSWSPYTACSSGTGTLPSFPAQGSSAFWICFGSGAGTNASCSATRQAAAACGSANGHVYAVSDHNWGGLTFCTSGNANPVAPNFMSAGSSRSWTCGTASCSASRLNASAPPPALTLNAAATTLTSGSSTQLLWTNQNATSCWASNGWTGWQASANGDHTASITPVATTTYSLECWNSDSVSTGVKSVTVTVNVTCSPDGTYNCVRTPSNISACACGQVETARCVDSCGQPTVLANCGGTANCQPITCPACSTSSDKNWREVAP